MVSDLEKSNSSMAIELGESKKMIETLQGEKEELQQWDSSKSMINRQKAKMESLYLALKKQQKQSISDSPISTPPLLGFSVPVSQNRNTNESDNPPPISQETSKFKGILVPVWNDTKMNNRNR